MALPSPDICPVVYDCGLVLCLTMLLLSLKQVRSKLSKNDRSKYNSVLIIDVHARDIIDSFVRDRSVLPYELQYLCHNLNVDQMFEFWHCFLEALSSAVFTCNC